MHVCILVPMSVTFILFIALTKCPILKKMYSNRGPFMVCYKLPYPFPRIVPHPAMLSQLMHMYYILMLDVATCIHSLTNTHTCTLLYLRKCIRAYTNTYTASIHTHTRIHMNVMHTYMYVIQDCVAHSYVYTHNRTQQNSS